MTGEPPNADVEAATLLRSPVIPGLTLESLATQHPRVLYRMFAA